MSSTPQVGVSEAELAELAARLGDRRGRVISEADEDLLGCEDDLDRVHIAVDVERVALVEILQQIGRSNSTRCYPDASCSKQLQ